MTDSFRMDITLVVPLVLQTVGLLVLVLLDSYIRRRQRRIMLLIIAIAFSLVVQNVLGYVFDENGHMIFARTLESIYGYVMRPVSLILFCYLIDEKRNFIPSWILLGINAVIYLSSLFNRAVFWIDESNHFQRGTLGFTSHIVSAIMLFQLAYLTFQKYTGEKKPNANAVIPALSTALIIGSVLLDTFVDQREYPVSYLTMTIVTVDFFFYSWLHLQFVREYEEDLRAKQRIQIMISQIQPHFLFNTLSTIQALCEVEPDKAGYVTEKFAAYLRQNIDSLGEYNLIPFDKELEHTKTYADIEMIRFPHIETKYFIEDSDFLVPALTVQPMVENAIRHGVRSRKKKGVVVVMTKRLTDCHEILVSDNGKGIDEDVLENLRNDAGTDGSHIGIRNVRERIEAMCRGTVSIESREGKGTIVRIRIPVGGGETLNAGNLRG